MARKEQSFSRDMTFHVNRRGYGNNIPATDLDFVEFDNLEPVLIWEAKSDKSHWKEGRRTASIIVQWKIAKRANITYRIVEHADDWSIIHSYEILSWDKMKPEYRLVGTFTLPQFVKALYQVRNRQMPKNLNVPDRLEPVSFGLAALGKKEGVING